eukprot:8811417-Karenia_brevis.AAC.1
MATFYEENAHIVPNGTYVIEGLPPNLGAEEVVKTFSKSTSDSHAQGWQVVPQGNPFISKGLARWK